MAVIDHIYIDVEDYDGSKSFYSRALAPLGIALVMERESMAGYGRSQKPELWIRSSAARPDDPCGSTTRDPSEVDATITPVHIAVSAGSRYEVDDFYREALAAGGRDNGEPAVRAEYHQSYYGAFVLDPNGHNLEAVFHGF